MQKQFLIALALGAASFAANATELSYNFIEGGYVHTHFDELDASGNGGGIAGSVEFGQSNIYAFGSAARTTATVKRYFGDFDIKANSYDLGIGYAMPLSEQTDLLFEGSYQRADTNGFSTDGYRISAGARSAWSDRVEGTIRVNYANSNDAYANDSFSVTPGILVKFNPTWGFVADADIGQDGQTYFAGVRASF